MDRQPTVSDWWIRLMATKTILVVDDEEDIRELLTLNLTREGYEVIVAETGEGALELAQTRRPALIILDLMLPGIGGLDACKILKGNDRTRKIPVIMLTAKSEESDVVAGLELGAADYIAKPFSSKVLVARVRRTLRTDPDHDANGEAIEIHDLVIDPERHEVRLKDVPLSLTRSEFDILAMLASRPGRVFTRYQIVDSLHGGDYIVSDRAVDVQITYLRKKLGNCKHYIETVRGVGYRFKDRRRT
jgi:two-component system phosphate regulon response regulator PhoB